MSSRVNAKKMAYMRRPKPQPTTPAEMSRLREEFHATAPARRDEIIKMISDPNQRAIALHNFDKEYERIKSEGIAKREEELKDLFPPSGPAGAGAGTSGGKRRKTRKQRKSKKSRRSTRKA